MKKSAEIFGLPLWNEQEFGELIPQFTWSKIYQLKTQNLHMYKLVTTNRVVFVTSECSAKVALQRQANDHSKMLSSNTSRVHMKSSIIKYISHEHQYLQSYFHVKPQQTSNLSKQKDATTLTL